MKEVARKELPVSATKAIYLSDRTANLAVVKNPPIAKPGIQLLGFQVEGLSEVEDRLKRPYGLTTRGGTGPGTNTDDIPAILKTALGLLSSL